MSTLFVSATGGHLTELVRLAPRLKAEGDATWVTFESEQARALLGGQRVVHARPVEPRDYRGVVSNLGLAHELMRGGKIERVISTGSGIALSFLPMARAHGVRAHYIECAARTLGPSMSGRILSAIPGVRLYAQYPGWARGRWHYGGSIYDGFEPGGERTPASRLRVAVAVGTMRFPFSRLVERIVQILPADADVLAWQTGATPSPAGVDGRATVPIEELRRAFRDADAVIAHAGIGTALDALDAGRMPILVPRLRRFGEHVDDHQLQVAHELERRGLALARSAEDLRLEDLWAVARRQIVAAPAISPFALRP